MVIKALSLLVVNGSHVVAVRNGKAWGDGVVVPAWGGCDREGRRHETLGGIFFAGRAGGVLAAVHAVSAFASLVSSRWHPVSLQLPGSDSILGLVYHVQTAYQQYFKMK